MTDTSLLTAKKLTMSYEDFEEWIIANQLNGETFDDTKDFLAYLGISMFEYLREKNPSMTLQTCCDYIFSDDNKAH